MDSELKCSVCDKPISMDRVQIYLDIKGYPPETCTECDKTIKKMAFEIYPHKTGGDVFVVDPTAPNGKENLRRLMREYHRGR
jgi:hypothetical protein